MKIAVHGASGFTGRLTVAEVRRRGFTPVLVGRDAGRLRKAAAEAGAQDAELRVAGLDEPGALADALRDCAAVVNCAGPFTLLGTPVIRAALAAGVHYLDTTGEQGYLKRVLEEFGLAAERAGVSVVPAMADDGGLGDLIAHLTAERAGPEVADLLIADLRRPGAVSRGTARSMASVFAEGALEYAGGAWRPAVPGDAGTMAVPGEDGETPVTAFALPGVVTIPRHVRAGRVRSAIRADVAALFGALTADVVDSVPEVPDPAARLAARWLMLAEATAPDGRRARGWVSGLDAYGMTAVIAVEGARRLVADGARPGVLTPAQAFDPAAFLSHLAAAHDVTWQVTQEP
ncbi:saccharopine dehydrogenase NADP-binding domain-containing protein [Actinomadura sp. ATCC 31491]|uniref:Saccharopine dehydrogenase NADP-binding domain-containing protein n=1 Tax=Actinomadura luzonensis TaxID=2805427 RepID=A0ABT0G5X5_9ACTN|nr:saccharopine dehydrogenase NADP-binding domain-containing protein [Actinomadura luzonensis]MCK2219985.1 saccharopine dehydrogenase NADP-binding domain-containing protein [Actinomadura luzonensis]